MTVSVPVREATSRPGLEKQIATVLGVPVSIRNSEFRFLPSPRLVISDISAQNGVRLPELTIHFNWRDAMRTLQSATWILGEARVAPVKLNGQDAFALLQSVRRASDLTAAVSVIRFESVEFPDLAVMPGRYEGVIRRGVNQSDFNSVSLKRLDAAGQLDIEITPPSAKSGNAKFAMFATKWAAPAGPAITWSEATARGEFGADFLKVDSYSVGTTFANLNGAASLSNDGKRWELVGNLRGHDLSLEALAAYLAPEAAAPSSRPAPMRGTAKFDLKVEGNGADVAEALARASVRGPVSVASAALVGLNLGLVATHGKIDGAGGSTRFTDFDLEVAGSNGGLAIREIVGRAGSLRVLGAVNFDRNLAASGALRTEVASPRGVATSRILLSGTATALNFK